MRSNTTGNSFLGNWEFKSVISSNGAIRHYDGPSSNIGEWQRSQPEKVLGRGAFGVVWSEECISDPPRKGRVRAVKKILNGRQKFIERELEALVAFSTSSDSRFQECQRYLVQFYGWFQIKDDIFIAMELVEHRSLQEYVRQKHFTEPAAAAITLQTARALQLIHGLGFAHRDLKPANILVARPGPDWWVKVADFGIAKSTEGTQLDSTRVGTVDYMAPEVHRSTRGSQSYSLAVDIWSLGAVVFCLLTQKPPFGGLYDVWEFARGDTSFPEEELSRFSPLVTNLIIKAMKSDPHQRPTAEELLEEPWLQLFTEHVDRMFKPSVYSFNNQKQERDGQQHSWNGAASNRWTEPAQGPRSEQQTTKPYVPASNSFVRPHGMARPIPALNGPTSNAWSAVDPRTGTRLSDSGQQQIWRPYNPTSTIRPYAPVAPVLNDALPSELDVPSHGIRAWASNQDLRGGGVHSSHRPSTPTPPFPSSTALPAENVSVQPEHWLSKETIKPGLTNKATFPPSESVERLSLAESHGQRIPNPTDASRDSAKPMVGPPPGRKGTTPTNDPRLTNCTQHDCRACQNGWKANQCLRCGKHFSGLEDRSFHLAIYKHYVNTETHEPEYYNKRTREWVPIRYKHGGKASQDDGRAAKNNLSSKDSRTTSADSSERTTLRPAWIFNHDTGLEEANRDRVCMTCLKDFQNRRVLHEHLAQRKHGILLSCGSRSVRPTLRPARNFNQDSRPAWILNQDTGRQEPNRERVCLTCQKDFHNSRMLHEHLVQRKHWYK